MAAISAYDDESDSSLTLGGAARMLAVQALGVALMLAAPRPGAGTARALTYMPSVVPDVAYALLWLWILNPAYGPVSLLLQSLGLNHPRYNARARQGARAFAFLVTAGNVIMPLSLKYLIDDALGEEDFQALYKILGVLGVVEVPAKRRDDDAPRGALVDEFGVEGRRRFVVEHDLRRERQGAGNFEQALLAVRQVTRLLVSQLRQAHKVEQAHGAFVGCGVFADIA